MEPIWNELNLERVAGRAAAQAFVEGDIPMPGGREAQRLLQTDAQIQNESARTADGQVQVEGTLTLFMLCLDTDNAPFDVHASTRYSHTIPMEGVQEGMRAEVTPQLMDLRTTLRNNQAHVEAVAELNTLVRQDDSVQVMADIRDARDLQTQYTDAEMSRLKRLAGATFHMHEELEAPGVAQVLRVNAAPFVKSVTLTEDGAEVEGTLYLLLLYTNGDNMLMQALQQAPFSELVPLEMDVSACGRIVAVPSVSDVSGGVSEADTAQVSATVGIDMFCITRDQVHSLTDAYSADGDIMIQRDTMDQLMPAAAANSLCRVSETLRVPEESPDVSRVIFASARPTLLSTSDNNGKLAADGILITAVVYESGEGGSEVFEEDVPFRCTLDAPYSDDAQVRVRALEVRASGTGRMIQVDYLLETTAQLFERQQITVATGMEPAAPAARDNAIFLHFVNNGETLWDIGKAYGVTVDQLRRWNPQLTEPLADGTPVLIFSNSGRRRA